MQIPSQVEWWRASYSYELCNLLHRVDASFRPGAATITTTTAPVRNLARIK
jgi:hypothetical protein